MLLFRPLTEISRSSAFVSESSKKSHFKKRRSLHRLLFTDNGLLTFEMRECRVKFYINQQRCFRIVTPTFPLSWLIFNARTTGQALSPAAMHRNSENEAVFYNILQSKIFKVAQVVNLRDNDTFSVIMLTVLFTYEGREFIRISSFVCNVLRNQTVWETLKAQS